MNVREVNNSDMATLVSLATDVLEPLYGDQTKAVREWTEGGGHKHAYMVVSAHDERLGFLCIKAKPGRDYLKISTLYVLDDHRTRGIGKRLLELAEEYALFNGYKAVVVTVSEKKRDVLPFYHRHGYHEIDRVNGKYVPGIDEYILRKEI
jgi:ribosomal protein S18 acetylase RimI-like enzyme